jgi:hypothetical protein
MLRLVPDCGGLIRSLAITLPPFLFAASQAGKRQALQNLAQSLTAGTELILLVETGFEAATREWVSTQRLRCSYRILAHVPAGAMCDADLWTQDTFLAAEDDGLPQLLPLHQTDHPGQHARWLAAAGYAEAAAPPLHLAGGNHLTGPDFRLVGAQSVLQSASAGGWGEALARHEGLDARHLHVFGFPLLQRGHPPALAQQPDHLDLVLTVTGITAPAGQPLLLLADPRIGCDPDGPPVPGWSDQLDASAARLTADGFAVIRNKVPYLAHPLHAPNPTLRAYNNVILENDIRHELGNGRPLVWLPHFGDHEPDLEPFDRMARRVWEDLGFAPIPVHGWSAMLRAGGALRCAGKVLRRASRPTRD